MALTLSDVKKVYIPKNTRVYKNNKTESDAALVPYNDAINLLEAIQVVNSSSSSGAGTDLSIGAVTTTTLEVESSTGNPVILPQSTPLQAGLQSASDKTKLDLVTVTQAVNLDEIEQDVADLTTLTGVSSNATNLGSFSGSTIPDNVDIKSALQSLETALSSASGYSENGLSGDGSSGNKYKLGGLLTQNTTIDGNYLRNLTVNKLNLLTLESFTNVNGTAKSSLLLTTLPTGGAILKSEVVGTPNRYSQLVVDSDGGSTLFQNVYGSLKSGLYLTSNQVAILESTDGTTTRRYTITNAGHSITGINTGVTSKIIYIDDVTGDLYKGDVPSTSGGSSIHTYDAGSNALVRASGTGVTFSKASGIGTFTVPPGVSIYSARINGVTADLAGDKSFSIVTPVSNLDDYPTVTKINRVTGASPSTSTPYVYDIDNSPLVQVTESTSSLIKVRVINLDTYTHWALKLNF